MGDAALLDYTLGVLRGPWRAKQMGITAENVAKRFGISRRAQDALALESQRRAAQAQAQGWFASQIVPVTLKVRSGQVSFDTDEHVRGDATAEQLASMKPAFDPEGGCHYRQLIRHQ